MGRDTRDQTASRRWTVTSRGRPDPPHQKEHGASEQVLVGVLEGGELDVVQRERADGGVVEVLAGGSEPADGVLSPQTREVRAGLLQPLDERTDPRVVGAGAVGGPELADQLLSLTSPVGEQGTHGRAGEQQPDAVAFGLVEVVEPPDERVVGPIVGQQVPALVHDVGRVRIQGGHQRTQHRSHLGSPRGRLAGQRLARQGEQVPPLGRGQQQRAGQRVDDLAADGDVALLLQPRVPGHAHPGQLWERERSSSGSPPTPPASMPTRGWQQRSPPSAPRPTR